MAASHAAAPKGLHIQIGIDSFAAILPEPDTGRLPSATDRMAGLLEEVEIADRVGLDVFGIGDIIGPNFWVRHQLSFWRRRPRARAEFD